MEELRGMVENVVFQSDDGQFSVFKIKDISKGMVTVACRAGSPFLGESVVLSGVWDEHPRFGRQFKAMFMQRTKPSDIEAVERFLASGAVKGIGRTMAARITAHFGSRTLEILDEEPMRLTEISGIGKVKARGIGEAYAELSEMRELMLFLEQHGVSSNYAPKLQAQYGNSALMRIKENPYALADDIAGIGFRTADKIALSMGSAIDNEERITAGLAYTLSMASTAGHTCVPEELLVREAVKLLRVDELTVFAVLKDLIARDRLRTEDVGGLRLIYPEYLYQAETQVASRLLRLRDATEELKRVNVEKVIKEWETESGFALAEEQKEAIYASLKYGIFVLTGGPGTGKTTVVKGILRVLEKAGCRILLAAPTGRAARRLAESSGRTALTVHRLLEYQPTGDRYCFGKNESDPLDAEAIIIDEASMLDITLIYHLLKAVQGGCRLIFVGDVDQLPSVGAGTFLKDVIRSKQMPVVRLQNVFRQAEVSMIVRNAHKINHGQMPDLVENGDFKFVELNHEAAAADFVVSLYERLSGDSDWQNIQVLSPMHKNVCGVQNLNKLIQERLNPYSEDKPEIALPGMILRRGDKVMQIRNNYEKEVFNGDIGIVCAVGGKSVTVEYPDNRVVYTQSELDELQLAYAMSVHKSQGSEYPTVILLLVSGHYIMLQRNLLYTAVTRAKQQVVLVGEKRALQTAVMNDTTRKRYSLLAERLQEAADIF